MSGGSSSFLCSPEFIWCRLACRNVKRAERISKFTLKSTDCALAFDRIISAAHSFLLKSNVSDAEILDRLQPLTRISRLAAYFPTLSDVREAVTESGAYDIYSLECVRTESGPAQSGKDVQGEYISPLLFPHSGYCSVLGMCLQTSSRSLKDQKG